VRRNLKAIALTVSPQIDNLIWQKDIMSVAGLDPNHELPFPIISDHTRSISHRLGMIRQKDMESGEMPTTVRNVCFSLEYFSHFFFFCLI
jgi:alkyl hydroperoxide reductase subunit AhpC